MKYLLTLFLAIFIMGCGASSTTPPQATCSCIPRSADDQKLGQSLAALCGTDGFVAQEKVNYSTLPAAQKAPEKPYLNALIDACNVANAAYTAYHAGTGTFASAQGAFNTAAKSQTVLVGTKGVK